MCGRYGRITRAREFSRILGLDERRPSVNASYNNPPGLFALCAGPGRFDLDQIAMQTMYWGFIPSWEDKPGKAPINARAETALTALFGVKRSTSAAV